MAKRCSIVLWSALDLVVLWRIGGEPANLNLKTEAQVTRVLFTEKIAVGGEYISGKTMKKVFVNKEVIFPLVRLNPHSYWRYQELVMQVDCNN